MSPDSNSEHRNSKFTTNLGPETRQIFVRKMDYSSTWLRPPKMRGSRIREYSPRIDVHAARFRPHFFLFSGGYTVQYPFWLFHVICSCVIGVESQVKWKNSRVLGYYYEIENEKRDLGIPRIFALKKTEIPDSRNYYS
jgi:hypothetical protein